VAKEIKIRINGDTSGLDGSLEKASGKIAGLGKAVAAAGLAMGAGVLAAGAGLFKLGSSFDDAYDTIRVGTGATGEALDGLKDSFKTIAKEVPDDFGAIGTAVADLNTRLGLSGKPLEDLSVQMLNLSRITKTDVGGNIESATRLMGDWGVAAEDAGGALDMMFRASQATGPSVAALSDLMVKFGAPLRQMGFGFEESAALLGKFEKEGVNTELVMGSMRQALGKFARAGEDAPTALRRISDEIKAMEDPTAATAMAMEVFGARAGPDMAAAIREGRFELGDLYEAVKDGTETINGASSDTESFGEKWGKFSNRIKVALEPLAMKVFDAVGEAMDRLGPIAEDIVGKLIALWERFGPSVTVALQRVGDAVRTAFVVIVTEVVPRLVSAFQAVARVLVNQVWPVVQSVFRFLMDHKEILVGIAVAIGVGLVVAFTSWAIAAGAAAVATIAAMAPVIAIGAAIAALVAGVIYAYQNWGWFKDAVDAVASFLTGTLWPILQTVASFLADKLVAAFQAVSRFITGTAVPAFSAVWSFIRDRVIPVFSDVVRGIADFVSAAARRFEEFKTSVATKIGEAVQFVRDLPGRFLAALGDLGGLLRGAGRALIDGLIGGITSKIESVKSTLKGVTDLIPSWKGPMDYDAKLLTPNGEAIMDGLRVGLERGSRDVMSMLGGVAPQMSVEVSRPSSSFQPVASGGGVTVVQHVHGSVLSQRDLVAFQADAARRGYAGAGRR